MISISERVSLILGYAFTKISIFDMLQGQIKQFSVETKGSSDKHTKLFLCTMITEGILLGAGQSPEQIIV